MMILNWPAAWLRGTAQIDASEHEIEHRCLQLLLRQQPVASDLRKVSTALKMVTDVERIGDQASDIAELVLHLHSKSTDAVGVLEDILKMGDDVLKMVKRSIAAYVQVDLAVAAEVIAHDDVIDASFARISSEIAQYIAAHPTEAETALDLFMVTKYLERLGDHAVNVAEWVEFLKTGVHKSRARSCDLARRRVRPLQGEPEANCLDFEFSGTPNNIAILFFMFSYTAPKGQHCTLALWCFYV